MVWYSKLWVKICLLVVVAGSAVGVYAYYVLFQSTGDLKVSITSEPLRFSMELDKSEYLYGENMTIKFRLENIGNETVTIQRLNPGWWHPNYTETSFHNVNITGWNPNGFHFGFSIVYTNGTEFFKVGSSLLDFYYYLEIGPSGWIEQTIIARILDTPDYMGNQYYRIPLPTGNYQIKGVIPRYNYAPNPPPDLTLETPSISFFVQ